MMAARRGRPPTGAPKWNPSKKVWEARIWRNGKREAIPMRNIPQDDRARAVLVAAAIAAQYHDGAAVAGSSPETFNEWSSRWLDQRVVRGLSSVDDDRSRVKTWIAPTLGTLPMGEITRVQIEDLRDGLDERVRKGDLSWKTATHCWGLVTRMFADACGAKRRELRVREDNPAANLEGPDRGLSKAKVYLYPAEFLAVVSCERIPLRWRRFIAVTTYLAARAGEVKALSFEDVDLERGIAHIHESMNRYTGETKSTKTGVTRRIPIEGELLPLLKAMRDEMGGPKATGRLFTWAAKDRKLSRQMQRCLRLAGVKRADLFADDESRKPMTFHDLRATGITWAAVRGDEPLRIKQRAGHATFSTTEGYIREAENLRAQFGEVFPPLPSALLGTSGPILGFLGENTSKTSVKQWSRRESNPGPKAPLSCLYVRSRRTVSPRVVPIGRLFSALAPCLIFASHPVARWSAIQLGHALPRALAGPSVGRLSDCYLGSESDCVVVRNCFFPRGIYVVP